MQYDRLTDEEKLEMYLELEPDLLIYDQAKNEEKIRRLKEANTKLADQAERIREQEGRIRSLERMYSEHSVPRLKERAYILGHLICPVSRTGYRAGAGKFMVGDDDDDLPGNVLSRHALTVVHEMPPFPTSDPGWWRLEPALL